MKVFAVNGSPKMEQSLTAALLNPFLDGMEEAGAQVSRYDRSAMSIEPCQGCFACSINQTGECWQKDDLSEIYQDVVDADVWVFATPVYVSGMTGPLKTLIDRLLIPLGEPKLSLVDGHCHHAMCADVKRGKIILVSSCAYWEMDNFDLLISQLEALCEHAERTLAASLLRPHAPAFGGMLGKAPNADDVVAAAKEAGVQFAQSEQIAESLLTRVSQPLLPLEAYTG